MWRFYSARNAIIGSTRVARRAGRYPATVATVTCRFGERVRGTFAKIGGEDALHDTRVTLEPIRHPRPLSSAVAASRRGGSADLAVAPRLDRRLAPHPVTYSARNAVDGATAAARRAGSQLAAMATVSSAPATAA